MSGPIVFISCNKIKKGKADDFRKHYRGNIAATMAARQGTQAQLAYENEDATEVVIVFPNTDALDQQLQGADERSKKTYELIEPTGIEILGTPNPATVEKMKGKAGSGVAVKLSPYYAGGFV